MIEFPEDPSFQTHEIVPVAEGEMSLEEGFARTSEFLQARALDIREAINDGQDAVELANRMANLYEQRVDPRVLPGFFAVALVLLAQKGNLGD